MEEKTCHNCNWYDDLTGYGVECVNPGVDHMMPDGTCPEWEQIDPDGDIEHKQLADSYVPNAWDKWKKEVKNVE